MYKYIHDHSFDETAKYDLDKIDEHMAHIMLTTEQDLTSDSKPYYFSDVTVEQIVEVRQFKQVISLRRKRKYDQLRAALAFNPGLSMFAYLPMPELLEKQKQARANLTEMQENSWCYREAHLDKLYEKAAKLFNKDKMQVINEMKDTSVNRLGLPRGMSNNATKEIWDYINATDDNDIQ